MSDFTNIVSTQWLADNLRLPELRIIDASWYMPAENRDAFAEFKSQHIPGAQYFDIDDISDDHSDLPHMAPDLEKFVSRTRKLGIADGTKVVIYDGAGIFSAPRVWWLFKLFNKTDVAVLDGGLPKWIAEGREVTSTIRAPRDRHLTLTRRDGWSKTVSEVAQASKLQSATILDARAPERFEGAVPEPREGLRSGHIPNAKNLFFKELLNSNGTYKSVDQLKAVFSAKGVNKDDPIITSCGSGVTASVISLALDLAGYTNHALYDGLMVGMGRELFALDRNRRREMKAGYTVSFLEMISQPSYDQPKLNILSTSPLPPAYFRAMYTEVGRKYQWDDLLREPEDVFNAYCAEPQKTMHTLMMNNAPAGFFVLNPVDGVTDLSYFGLLDDAIGHGLGVKLLEFAIHEAWKPQNTKKVTVNTCTLDHPRALSLYISKGFVITRTEDRPQQS